MTAADIIAEGLMKSDQWDEAATKSLAVFARGREIAARQGLILVDTKFEFGLDNTGHLVLADEILTPDSSRYWLAESYPERHARGREPESLDKEFLRLWIRERCDPYRDPIPEIPDETLMAFSARYVRLFETVTGRSFRYPDPKAPVRSRLRAALAAAFKDYF